MANTEGRQGAGGSPLKGAEGVSRRRFMIRAGTMAGGVILGGGAAAATAALAGGAPSAILPIEPIAFSTENPLRLALIGAGQRMRLGLLTAILERDDVRIVACADPNPANLNKILDRIEGKTGRRPQGMPGAEDHLRALARGDIQAAFSACPCDLHGAIYLEALKHGKHMYGEKPLALTLAETRAIEAARPGSRTILQIGFQRRASRRYAEGIRMIQSGELGPPISADAAWSLIGPPPALGQWIGRRAHSGDWMLEGCHVWDALRWAAGASPVAAYGAGRRDLHAGRDPGRDVTDSYRAILEYPNGMIATFTHGGLFNGHYERIACAGGEVDLGAGRIAYAERDRKPLILPADEADMTRASVGEFLECVREGRQPESGVEAGVDATLAGLLVRKAVDERRRVTMEEILAG